MRKHVRRRHDAHVRANGVCTEHHAVFDAIAGGQQTREACRTHVADVDRLLALEHAARPDGTIRSGNGIATERVGPLTHPRVVDAIVSGVHERGTSHYELLRAFQDNESLERMESEVEARGYRRHEFGDSVFLERSSKKFLEAVKDDDNSPRRGAVGLARPQSLYDCPSNHP